MSPWNEVHYARVQEFARLLADAVTSASMPHPVPAAPAKAPEPAAPPARNPAAITTIGKIPWKR
jgi:hypothetical protein